MGRLLATVGITAVLVAGALPFQDPTGSPSSSPSSTSTTPVVPIPALYSAQPTPPTCANPGSFDFSVDVPNIEVSVSPEYDGPGTYTLTITALNGAVFPDGETQKTREITVLGAIGFQSTNPNAPCYLAPSPTPTTTTPPVVPIPALYAAEPTPPTCETAGSFDFSGQFPNVTVSVSPAYTGPGTYTLTVTAINGAVFPDNTTVKTRTITVAAAIGFQSTDAAAPCFQESTPTPTPTPSVGQFTATPGATPSSTPSGAVLVSTTPNGVVLAATGSSPQMWFLASAVLLAGIAASVLAYRRRRAME